MFSRLGGSIVAAKVEGSASIRNKKSFEGSKRVRKQWQQQSQRSGGKKKRKKVVGQSNKEVPPTGAMRADLFSSSELFRKDCSLEQGKAGEIPTNFSRLI